MRRLPIIFLLAATVVFGQSIQYRPYVAYNAITRDTYSFPIFSYPQHPAVADSINEYLAADFLDADFAEGPDSLFTQVWASKGRIASLNDVSFEILYDHNDILSIVLSGEGCGAYCEYFTKNYNFDLRSGKRIYLDTLFTEAGLRKLATNMGKRQMAQIKKELRSVRRELAVLRKSKHPNPEDLELAKDQLELYETCLEHVENDGAESFLSYSDDYDFSLSRAKITISVDRCSNHAMMAIDELGDFQFTFAIADLRPYLTPYGAELLGRH